jgi:HEAT repeat protein
VRLDAAVAVRKIGGRAAQTIPALVGLLAPPPGAPPQELVWAAAAEELGEIGGAASVAVPALCRVVSMAGGEARDEAARALGKIGPPAAGAVPALLQALGDDAPFFRIDAAEALLRIDTRLAEPVWALVDVLKDRTHPPFARRLAIRGLTRARPVTRAIVALIDAKATGDALVADLAGEVLSQLAPEASRDSAEYLREALRSDEPCVRVTAAEAVWKYTGRADRTIPVLVDGLGVGEPLARRWAARALGDARPEHGAEVLPALRDRLGDDDLQVRTFAAEAIWNIGGDGHVAVVALVDVLRDRNHPGRARERAAYALGRIGPAARDAAQALREAAADQACWDVHVAATRALEKIAPAAGPGAAPAPSAGLPVPGQDYPPR